MACGSAHTLAWSTNVSSNTGKLPKQVSRLEPTLIRLRRRWNRNSQARAGLCRWSGELLNVADRPGVGSLVADSFSGYRQTRHLPVGM